MIVVTGEYSRQYTAIIEETSHWANAEVVENYPLEPERPTCLIGDRSLLSLGNTDNGVAPWVMYGPRSLAVGTPVELFLFKVYGKWKMDFRVIKKDYE